ncbi:universal stress protein [Natronolimnohabitans innermongolicus]|uniref:UspA domain-containing protein n=1 Tax=Natronolimnohabitans innermongolicus JCM 12255 TaxID=1227499 RepID=L9XAF6_9EURY|nr:universal stress protein [Natronolimnohabitans innermongolicus]ELY58700.1 UspA domain-containing protein [Natronolimnohabitans innermongolicus JCM 12255]
MLETILVPTDGSPGAEATIDHAIELATTYGAAVHALSVVDAPNGSAALSADDRDELADASRDRGREMTIRITDRAEERGLDAARAVREGTPHEEILAYTDEHDVDLIAMGTRGRTGADLARLGSTTERVLTLADVPVLSIGLADDGTTADPGEDGYDRIVIPTDGSDAAERAAERAIDLATRYDADVHVVYIVDTTTYTLEDAPRSIVGLLTEGGKNATDELASMARDRGLSATTAVQRGDPTDELLAYADGADADLLAMGTRGRTIGTGRLLGSTTARVVRRSPVPVLTVG